MPVRGRERHVRLLVHGERGRYVEEYRFQHSLGILDAQFMRDAGAAIVRAYVEFLMP